MNPVDIIQQKYPGFKPKVGIVLGSGLGEFAEHIESANIIPYSELPGFPEISVAGHAGNLILGTVSGVPIVVLQGRAHYYENPDFSTVKNYVRTLKQMGCEYFIATNAVGSLMPDVGPGSLVLIRDHINFLPSNPLIGPNDDDFGPRFLPMDKAYHAESLEKFRHVAEKNQIPLAEGIYFCAPGPMYETAAEIKAYRVLGADVVGMSTVPEVIVAHHCGLNVSVISIVTNFATGLATTSHDHVEVLAEANRAGEKLRQLISAFIAAL